MKKRSPLLSERMRIDKTLEDIRKATHRFLSIEMSRWIKDLRKRLHMSQKQLAKRAKITQSQLSQIESGKSRITIETLTKIFLALFCQPLILPFSQTDFADILKRQARLAAKKKLASLRGTMALENQMPSQKYLEKKMEEVAEDLLRSGSTEIWDV